MIKVKIVEYDNLKRNGKKYSPIKKKEQRERDARINSAKSKFKNGLIDAMGFLEEASWFKGRDEKLPWDECMRK